MTVTAGATALPTRPPAGRCPACHAPDREHVLEAVAPIHTSVLLRSRDDARAYPRGSIRLERCRACGFISNDAFDAPGHDYSASYEESQAFSPRFQEYAAELAASLASDVGVGSAGVLEVGCGKGDFLARLCAAAGCPGVGVDPSFAEARPPGPEIEVVRSFFADEHVDRAFALVVCRHTLEHVHDVRGFLQLLHAALRRAPGAKVFFEVPDTTRILRETAFWDIFYEHCSYFTPGSLARALRAAGFAPIALRLGFDDQYALATAVREAGAGLPTLDLEEPVEVVAALSDAFVRDVEESRRHWRNRLARCREEGLSAVVWGAGSKGVGFLATLGIEDEIVCAVDVNPAKHGMFMPGTGHEIVPPERLREVRPDLVVVMNPAYLDEISASVRDLGVDAEVVAL